MKTTFFCFKLSKKFKIFLALIIFSIMFMLLMFYLDLFNDSKNAIIEKQNIETDLKNTVVETSAKSLVENKIEYATMPENIQGYKVVGKIEISKINLSTYILNETNDQSLEISVTKLCGPEINQIGNFCISGHNYNNDKMFGKIKDLEVGDDIILTDTYGNSLIYRVYDKYKTKPKDTSCLNQETGGDKDLTLITCTIGALKRIIIKATESISD